MKLVYEKTGEEVKVGDKTTTFRGEAVTVMNIIEPYKPGSTGRVGVMFDDSTDIANPGIAEYYPSVIGAEWVQDAVWKPRCPDHVYYCDVENKGRFSAKTLEEIAAYLSGCFSFDPLKLWQWRNEGEKGIFRCAYGFRSADVGRIDAIAPEGSFICADCKEIHEEDKHHVHDDDKLCAACYDARVERDDAEKDMPGGFF